MLTEQDFENVEAAIKKIDHIYKNADPFWVSLSYSEKTLYEFAKKVLAEARRDFLTEARSSGLVIPEGWQLVPKEPTEAMIRQGAYAARDLSNVTLGDIAKSSYKEMLSTAPEPPEGE